MCAHLLSHISSLSQQHKSLQNVERCVRYLMRLQDLQVVCCAMAAIVESLLFMTQSQNFDFKMQ